MNKFLRLAATGIFLQLLLVPVFLFGQLPNARLHRVFPCSGKVGSQIEVNLAGADLDEATELVFSNPKITGKAKMTPATEFAGATPVPGQFVVSIPADVVPGIYEVRAFGRFGLSTSRRFVVSEHSEAVCNDQNKTPESAAALTLESSVAGRAVANGRHYYKFSLQQNEKVSIVCQAQSIDSKMAPVLVISDLSGNEIARGRSTTFDDATIFFKAPIASQYILSVRDAIFTGSADHFYRLTLTKKPYLVATHPVVIQSNSDPELTLYGWNLPGGKEEGGFESVSVKSSQAIQESNEFENLLLTPSSYSLDCKAVAIQQKGKAISNRIPISITGQAVVVEEQTAPFTNLTVPAEVSGKFFPRNETDEYRFSAKKGEGFLVDVYSHRFGKSTDAILMIQQQGKDGQGAETWKNVTVQDDPAGRSGAALDFSISSDDPSLRFQVPSDGNYRLLLKDQFGTYDKSPDSSYRISIRKPKPDFRLVCHPAYGRLANGNQILGSALTLRRGGRFQVNLQLARIDGFAGPVSIECQGLPEGITCETQIITERQSSAILTFYAKDDAAVGKSLIRIVGKAAIGDKEQVREAAYCGVTWDTGNKGQAPASFRMLSQLELSVMPHETAAVTVQAGDGKTVETSLGGKIKLPIKLTRRNKYVDPLKLTAINIPGQMKPGDITIAKDKSDGTVEIFVKDKNMPIGEYVFAFKGDAKFKYSRNPEAAARQEADYKRLQELLAKTNADKNAATTEIENLKKALPEMDKAIAAAKVAADAELKKANELTKQASELEKQLAEAKNNKQNKIGPLVLQAAEKQLADLKLQIKNGTSLQKSQKDLKDAEKKKSDASAKMASVQKQLAVLVERIKKVDAASKASKAKADQLKKQSAPKDLFYVAVSNPVRVRVVASPMVVESVQPMKATVESQANAAVKIQRKFGFADAVNLAFKAPKGIAIKPLTIAKDKAESAITVTIGKDCPVGDHTIEITASAKFNNVDVKTTSSFQIQVGAKAASAVTNKPAK